MNKLILFAAILVGTLPGKAMAYQEVVEVVRSSASVGGVICSTGTAIRLDTSVIWGAMGNGVNRHGVRVQNQSAAYSVWIGFNVNVSTDATSGSVNYLGEQLAFGSNAPYPLGNALGVWCKAADGAGAAGVAVSVMQTGYK